VRDRAGAIPVLEGVARLPIPERDARPRDGRASDIGPQSVGRVVCRHQEDLKVLVGGGGGIEADEQRGDLLTGRTPTGRKIEHHMVFGIQRGGRDGPVVLALDRPSEHL
jgi:hypothetical protein